MLPSIGGDGDCAYAQAEPSEDGDRLNKLGTAMSMLSIGERREEVGCQAVHTAQAAHVHQ